jgi:glycosyltransferase involved in cell wall biosynthesis
MKVLLLSPLAGLDPPNGDVTYTEQLLAQPPPGVEYVDYRTALAAGDLLPRAQRAEVNRVSGSQKCSAIWRAGLAKSVNLLRREEFIFREPMRFLTVRPNAFDLVHTHVFSVGYRGDWPPIVVSNSVPVEALYRDGLRWSRASTVLASGVDRVLARGLRVDHSTYHRSRAARFIAFTEHLKGWWVEQGVAPADAIDVIPCSVEMRAMRTLKSVPRVIGFFAGAPSIKGLDRALAIFRRVRQQGLEVEFWVIGSDDPSDYPDALTTEGVRWVGRLPRADLLSSILPHVDLLLHPTRFDGLPLSVLEAMSLGIPVVSSNYRAMPEVVGDAGRAVSSFEEACRAVEELMEPTLNSQASYASWSRQRRHFSPDAVLPHLVRSYERALSS